MTFKTEQEIFWAGQFGDDYSQRNRANTLAAANIAFFAEIIERTGSISSVLELGANIGLNVQAIRYLLPQAAVTAVEINKSAVDELKKIEGIDVYHESILDHVPNSDHDLVFTKGVLIHIDPSVLSDVYELMYRSSNRYVLVAEYYNPSPVEITYRGHDSRLFKRDFAGEILDTYPDLALVDYGFKYRRDQSFPQDDISWFLMEKR